MRRLLVPIVCLLLNGCAVSTVASLGVWGATGRGPGDHALSAVTGEDCFTLRVGTDEQVCQNSFDKQEYVFEQRQKGIVR